MNRSAFILSMVAMVFVGSCQPAQKKVTIGYLQITQDQVLDAAKAGIFRALADSGFIDGQNIKVLDNNAQGDLSMVNMILQSLISQNVDLIITSGTPCMAAAAQLVRNIPVVFTISFGPWQIGLKTIPDNLNGVYNSLDVNGFTNLMLECIPDLKRIGIPYNNAEPNAEYSVKVLSREFSERGIILVTASVNSSNDIFQAGQFLAGQDIDALVIAADNTVYIGLPVLARLAGEQNIPIFVSDALQAEKGAAIGYGVNYDSWGYLSGLKAVDILKGRADTENRIVPIMKCELIINRRACTEQGLSIPETLIGRATRILE